MTEVTLSMPCQTKQRPRVTRTGKAYMPRAYVQWKEMLGWAVLAQCKPTVVQEGDVALYMEIRVKRKGRGDDDNYQGAVLDALEGIVYRNDRQARVHAIHPDGRVVRRNTGEDTIILRW